MLFSYEFNSIDKSYEQYKKDLITFGYQKKDQRDDLVYQLPYYYIRFYDWYLNIGSEEFIPIPKYSNFNYKALQEYSKQLLNPELSGFVYTYGNRLRSYFNIDQIQYMINNIKNNENTRRAIAITVDPLRDNIESDIPCLQEIQITIYDKSLYMNVLFRSNDIKYAFIDNIYGLMNLQLYLSHKIGYKAGDLNYTCYNPHWKLK